MFLVLGCLVGFGCVGWCYAQVVVLWGGLVADFGGFAI